MGPQSRIYILVYISVMVSLVASPLALGQNPPQRGDYHIREDLGRRLYSISTFAHGHRHGYEEGFRLADEDIQLGRQQRVLQDKDLPKPDYKKEYGDRKTFQQGFNYGFVAGYKDSFASRSFRLVEWLTEIPPFPWMSELPQAEQGTSPTTTMGANFDGGMVAGYRAAIDSSVSGPNAKTWADEARRKCAQQAAAPGKEGYCDGFTQGFLLGTSDHPTPPKMPAGPPALAQNTSRPQ